MVELMRQFKVMEDTKNGLVDAHSYLAFIVAKRRPVDGKWRELSSRLTERRLQRVDEVQPLRQLYIICVIGRLT